MVKVKSILWIEDDQMLIDLYAEIIRNMPDFNVEFMKLGKPAIDRVKEIEAGKAKKPDLVMLDLLLPDISGDKILEEIKKTPSTKDILVYVLTNYGGDQVENKMTKELNAEKYLIKTEWGPTKLMSLIKKVLK